MLSCIYLTLVLTLLSMAYIHIFIVIMGITCVGFFTTLASRKGIPGGDMVLSLFGLSTVIGFAVFLLGKKAAFSADTTWIALLAGFGGGIAYFLFNAAVKNGHYGFSNAIYRSSYLIAVVFSVLVFKERISLLKIAGIILTTSSIFIISYSNDSFTKNARKTGALRWFGIILLSFFLSAMPRIGQNTVSAFKLDKAFYLFLSYAPAAMVFLVLAIRKGSFDKRALLYGGIGAIGSYASVYSTISAINSLGGVVVFPVTLTGPIILGLILSVVFFKERIKPLGYAGIALGAAGIILLSSS